MAFPDHITVYHKLRDAPTSNDSSFKLDVIILSELRQRPAARCFEDIVVYDYRKGQKTVLPTFMLEQFKSTFEEQVKVKKECGDRVRSLLDRVTALEKESWDREGAVEDFGNASKKP
jgi:hypothetical protein